jgi:MFS family permease
MNSARRTVAILSACQAMLLTNNATLIAINGLAGLALAPVKALATLPVTCWVVGGALSTMQSSLYMKRVGRRRGFMTGTVVGIAGALVCAAAIWLQSFWLLCFGALVFGVYNGFAQYYRFAAADAAPHDYKATAISLVLAGGLVGGILGPSVSRYTVDLFGPKFLAAYLALVLFSLVTLALLSRLKIPDPTRSERAAAGRPLAEIAAQPKFIVAVAAGAIGYGIMNFLMTSTPIAMGICGHPYGDAAFVISAHVVAMFAPSFITGPLVKRVGVLPLLVTGVLFNLAAIAIALDGIAVANFWWSLVTLGVGWNFLYIGGTTLLTETYRPEERADAQGANDLAIFIMMTLSSLTSGLIVTSAGWEKVNYAALPLVALVGIAVVWLMFQTRAARRTAV